MPKIPKKLFLILLSLVINLAIPIVASASTQTFNLVASPNFGSPIVSNFLENYKIETAALSPTQTAVTSEDTFVYYTWSLDLISDLPCPEATLQDIHIRASNFSTTEGDPDWSEIALYTNDGATTTLLDTIEQPVVEGTSATGVPFIARNNGVMFGQYDIGINGGMEGTWDLGDYNISNPIGIVVTHDAEDGTVGLQTTIESIQLTYDTTSCSEDVIPPSASPTAKPPRTGEISNLVVPIIILVTILLTIAVLLLRSTKHLKSKH